MQETVWRLFDRVQQGDAKPPLAACLSPWVLQGGPGWTQRWLSPGHALEHRCSFTIFRPGHKSQGGGWESEERGENLCGGVYFFKSQSYWLGKNLET